MSRVVVHAGDRLGHGVAVHNVAQRQHGEPVARRSAPTANRGAAPGCCRSDRRVAAKAAAVPPRRRPGTARTCPGGTVCPRSPGPGLPASVAASGNAACRARCVAWLGNQVRVRRSRRSRRCATSGSSRPATCSLAAKRGLGDPPPAPPGDSARPAHRFRGAIARPAIFPPQAQGSCSPARRPNRGHGGTPAPARRQSPSPARRNAASAPARISASSGDGEDQRGDRRETARQQRRQHPARHRQRDNKPGDGEQTQAGRSR